MFASNTPINHNNNKVNKFYPMPKRINTRQENVDKDKLRKSFKESRKKMLIDKITVACNSTKYPNMKIRIFSEVGYLFSEASYDASNDIVSAMTYLSVSNDRYEEEQIKDFLNKNGLQPKELDHKTGVLLCELKK